VAVDSSDNVIVTGYSVGSEGDYDYATIKYSSAGLPLWTNRYNAPGTTNDVAYAVAVDSSNNVVVTGYSFTNVGYGVYSEYATIKYSSEGAPLWANRYSGPANDWDTATAVTVDGNNDVIVTGYSFDYVGFGIYTEYATIKYSSAGVPLWTNRYHGPNILDSYARAVVVDGSNNVIVTGTSAGIESADYGTIKYSSAGVPLWTNCYSGFETEINEAYGVTVDHHGDVIVTGYSWISGTDYDYATVKYSSMGIPLWTNHYNGPWNGNGLRNTLAVDGSGNVIVTGNSYGGGGDSDIVTIKYSGTGVALWTNRYNGPENDNDYAQAVTVDHDGNVIVTGYSAGSGGDYDFATIKYICVPEPVMTALPLTNGTFQMRVDGVLQPGTLVIEASTNLAGWAPVFTNTTPTNVLFYADPDASNFPRRFYRAFQFP
jgi:uncharacterized delta-60 repeat protein